MTLEAFPRLSGIRGGAFYLHGEDHFRKEEVIRALVEAHIDPATKDFNLDQLRGTEVEAQTLASVLATPPMMAEWRVVVLREVEGLSSSKNAREELLRVASNPPPGLALVMSCTVPKGSKAKFYTELAKASHSAGLEPLAEADLPGWIMERAAAAHRLEFDVGAARALGAAIGPNLGVLARELDKLAAFVGDRRRVTVDDVAAAGTRLPAQDRWEWFDLVGGRRFAEARATLATLLGQGESGVGLVIGLATHLLRLAVAVEQGPRGLEDALPQHQKWLAGRMKNQTKTWTMPEIDLALAGLLDVDRLLKASPHTEEHFLESWLLTQLAAREAA